MLDRQSARNLIDKAIATRNYQELYRLCCEITAENNWKKHPIGDVIHALTELGKLYYGHYEVQDKNHPGRFLGTTDIPKAYLAFYTAIGLASCHPGIEATQAKNCVRFVRLIRAHNAAKTREAKRAAPSPSPSTRSE